MKIIPGTNKQVDSSAGLRQKAEVLAREQAARTPEDSAAVSPEETRKTLQELRVHGIELEMQNEELHCAQAEIEASRARYFDLYDLAPVGYVTISAKGLILEANLTAATLLDVNRNALGKQPLTSHFARDKIVYDNNVRLTRFILKEDHDVYYLLRNKLFETGEPQACELRMVKPDGAIFWARLEATAAKGTDNAPACRVVLSDITRQKQEQEALRKAHHVLEARVQERTADLVKLNEKLREEIERRRKFEADLKLQSKKILKEQNQRRFLSKKLVEILERERQAIAEALHNDVGQILAKLNMDIEDVIDSGEHAPIQADALVQIQSNIMKSMDYVSFLAGSLRPHILENLGLVPAIENMLNTMKKNSCVSIHLHTEGNFLQIADEKALAIYRIVQETVTNCLKHARAENIMVNLTRKDEFLSIAIEDDGTGFEYDKISVGEAGEGMLGLIIMGERAVQVGGELRVESQVGKGTRVIVETPVE